MLVTQYLKILLISVFFIYESTNSHAQTNCDAYKLNYTPVSLADAINYLDCKWSAARKLAFKTEPESDAVTHRHFGAGSTLRNNWGLLTGSSEIAKQFMAVGITQADAMSAIIFTSFHRHLNGKPINLKAQIAKHKAFAKSVLMTADEQAIAEFNETQIGETVIFQYSYDFISEAQETRYINDDCLAQGVVLAKNKAKMLFRVKLTTSCDTAGIVVGNKREQITGEQIPENSADIIKMKIGETKWLPAFMWETALD